MGAGEQQRVRGSGGQERRARRQFLEGGPRWTADWQARWQERPGARRAATGRRGQRRVGAPGAGPERTATEITRRAGAGGTRSQSQALGRGGTSGNARCAKAQAWTVSGRLRHVTASWTLHCTRQGWSSATVSRLAALVGPAAFSGHCCGKGSVPALRQPCLQSRQPVAILCTGTESLSVSALLKHAVAGSITDCSCLSSILPPAGATDVRKVR